MLPITLRQIEVFVAVAETGGFAAAANKLQISQASVSDHVSALEAQVGGMIFERRSGRKPVLTALGETVIKHARRLLYDANQLESALKQRRENKTARVVIACQRSVAPILQPILAQYAKQHPEVEMVIRVGRQEDVIAQIQNGSADLGQFLSYEQPAEIASRIIGKSELVLIASASHPLATEKKIAPAMLEAVPFVGPPPSMFGKAIEQMLSDIGISFLNIVAQGTEYQPIRELVLAKVGIGCAVKSSVISDVEAGHIVILDLDAEPLMMDVRLAVSDRKNIPAALQKLIAFLEPARSRA